MLLALPLLTGCVQVHPEIDRGVSLDDPRIDVRAVKGGDPSPADGIWMTRYTFEALTHKE